MFNQTHASQTTETLDSGTQSIIKTGMSNIGCSGLTASDQDLRKTKNELFSKLIERQQTVVTTHNKTISEENLSSSQFVYHAKAGSSDLANNVGFNVSHNHVIATTTNGLQPILFSRLRRRWYTNDEVASILTNFNSHPEWQTNELQVRPQSGAVLLYSREKVRYRQDGYCWKKRKNGRTTREDHMKLKVQGIECIYGCYVHSALLPTFHRRCYWLLENPDIVLVHYLNQPPDDKNKMIVTFNFNLLEADTRRKWSNEEIIEEIGSVFGGISQIHNTLSINFPTVDQQQALSLVEINKGTSGGDIDRSLARQLQQQNPPDSNCDTRGLITSSGEVLVTLPENGLPPSTQPGSLGQSMSYPMGDDDDSNNMFNMISTQDTACNKQRCDDDEVMTTNSQDSNSGSNEYCQQHANEQILQQQASDSSETVGACDVTVKLESSPINFSVGQNDTDAQQATTSRRDADRDYQSMGQDPCSPVTQIYNKIVDDIETYVLPLEMNQYDSVIHQHHHDHQAHNLESTAGGVQMMDTCEQDQHHRQHKQSPHVYRQSVAEVGNHQYVANHRDQTSGDLIIKQEEPDMSPVELLSCDLFTNCNSNFGDESQTGTCSQADQQQRPSNDMLLTDFNLRSNSQDAGSSGHQIMSPMTNPEDMGDLMMGISSGERNQSDETTQQSASDQLLLGCETSDTLELFDFKQLTSNCEYRHRLDVKSTTSDTDTLNRLSPIITLVPRCNSTDNAVLQGVGSSIQRMDNQYQQHHASSHFLSTTPSASTVATAPFLANPTPPMQNFTEYDNHHHELAISGVHRSATTTSSTEPSNSTSCSASPSTSSLINAGSASGHGAGRASIISGTSGYMNSGPCSGIPSVGYQDSSSSSFIKLPLPQRQNSEQREPSNSVLSSLLPKALSLDGGDLSSTSYRHHNYHQTHHHHHQAHQNRTSPLIGSYHRGGSGVGASQRQHTSTLGGKGAGLNAQVNQEDNNMLLIPPSNNLGSLHQGVNSRHYYQRPSAPSLSPSSGNYSLDSSTSSGGGGRVFASGTQYRSGSVVATSASVSQLISQQRQNQHLHQAQQGADAGNFSRLRTPLASHARLLPILDYVPNWSHSSGGTKVLLIGNWCGLLSDLQSSSTLLSTSEDSLLEAHVRSADSSKQKLEGFTILFDDLIVSACLIQDNVLRCYSPRREPGFIALKVVYKNLIVSEQVLFEVRATAQVTASSSAIASAT